MTLDDKTSLKMAAAVALGALVLGWFLRGVLTAPHDSATSATYGDWVLVCPTRAAVSDSCRVTQSLIDKRSGGRILRVILGQKNGQPSVAVETPTNVLLTSGVALKLDPGQMTKTIPYDTCDASGCLADESDDPSTYAGFVNAKKINVVIGLALANRPVVLRVSTNGLSDAVSAASGAEHRRHSWFWRAFL